MEGYKIQGIGSSIQNAGEILRETEMMIQDSQSVIQETGDKIHFIDYMIQNILDKLRAQDTVPVQITSLFPNLNYTPQFGHLTFHVSKGQGTFEP